MDVYRDYFNREELTKVLAQQPYTPGLLTMLNLFTPVPLSSTTMAVEIETKNTGQVLASIMRGAPRRVESLDKRKVVTFSTASYGDEGAVMADEVLNLIGGNMVAGARAVLEDRRAKLVAKLRRTVDRTREYLFMQALLNPASTEFGSAAASAVIAVQTTTTKLRKEIFDKVIVPMNNAMDGLPYTGIVMLCSDGYWSDFIEATSVKETFLNAPQAVQLQGNIPVRVNFGGIDWMWYRGDSSITIPANEARAVPTGAFDVGYVGYAPNDTVESVGSGALGQPYYMGSKPIVDSQGTKGWEVSIQAHMKAIWARPAAVLPFTKT